MKRAIDFQRRGIARIIDGMLVFNEAIQQALESRRSVERGREMLQRNGAMYFWNGDSRGKDVMYKPGQRRS
jgi:hypothetical protein